MQYFVMRIECVHKIIYINKTQSMCYRLIMFANQQLNEDFQLKSNRTENVCQQKFTPEFMLETKHPTGYRKRQKYTLPAF